MISRRNIRHTRIRKKVVGTSKIPRLSVFRSNRHVYAQLIDDLNSKTILALSDDKMDTKKNKQSFSSNKQGFSANKQSLRSSPPAADAGLKLSFSSNKIDIAKIVGLELAAKAKKKGVEKIVFDRSGYKYHGRIKSLAEGLREGGLLF